MPVYQITAPDGRKLRITAPEGATQEQVLAYARQQYAKPDFGNVQSRADTVEQQRPSDPTEGMSGFGKFMAGVGKSVYDTGRGVGQLLGVVDEADVRAARERDAALMNTGAGTAGNITGQAAQMAVPLGGGARLASLAGRAAPFVSAAARTGAFSGLQGTVEGESRIGNAAQGAALGVAGQGIASAAGGLARGVASRLSPADRSLLQGADQVGIRLGAGQVSQNPLVRTVASQMDRLPFSGARNRAAQNQAAFNEAVSGSFGMPSREITPEVFAKAQQRLGSAFEELTGRNSLQLSAPKVEELRAVVDEARRLAGPDTARKVQAWADELLGRVDQSGTIPGKAYQSFDSRLGKELKGGGEAAHYLGSLREVVRGAMDDSISAQDRAAWQAVRQQYANLKTVEPLVAKSTTGDISPQALMGRVTADKAGKARMARGNGGTLGELAKIGQRYMKDAPNSGTADRLLVNAGVLGGLYGGSQAGVIDPDTATKLGVLLLANRAGAGLLRARGPVMGDSAALKGLARLLRPAPYLLPAGVAGATETDR